MSQRIGSYVKKVIAFDPGGTTGYAIHNVRELGQDVHSQVQTYDYHVRGGQLTGRHHVELWRLLSMEDPDVVVCEDFDYRIVRNQGVAQPGIVLISCDYRGVIELYCRLTGKQLVMQKPAQGKGFWVDDKLKRLNLYTAGEPHRNDATRHLLYYVVEGLGRKDYLLQLRQRAK